MTDEQINVKIAAPIFYMNLAHLPLDIITAISQTIFSDAFREKLMLTGFTDVYMQHLGEMS